MDRGACWTCLRMPWPKLRKVGKFCDFFVAASPSQNLRPLWCSTNGYMALFGLADFVKAMVQKLRHSLCALQLSGLSICHAHLFCSGKVPPSEVREDSYTLQQILAISWGKDNSSCDAKRKLSISLCRWSRRLEITSRNNATAFRVRVFWAELSTVQNPGCLMS